MDAALTGASSCTSDSHLHSKTARFNSLPYFFSHHHARVVHHLYCWILKQEKPKLILFIVSALLFSAHQVLQRLFDVNIPFIDNYLDPIVLMPLLLYAVLWERRILLKNKSIVLTYTEVFGYFLLVVLVGEVFFPILSDNFTADYWDVLAYGVGTLAYTFVSKASNTSKPIVKSNR